jgi:hypothetical protein
MLALGIIIPFATSHAFLIPGTLLLPMHYPEFISGILLGPGIGAAVGIMLPLINSLITGMPVMFPMVPIMTAELFTYGLVSGFLYNKTPLGKKRFGIFLVLIISMISGRISYGLVFHLFLFVFKELKALSVIAATVTALPGIALQIILIPTILKLVKKIKETVK